MKLLNRYILREMVVPFLIGQAAIVLMLTGSLLYNNAQQLVTYQVSAAQVARMVLYFLPFLVHMTMPVAMAVAASLAVSRLGHDSEITVMRAAGASLWRIFRPIFFVGLLVSIGDFYFGEYILPSTIVRFQQVMQDMVLSSPRLSPQTGQWIISNDQSYAIFVQSAIPKKDYIELHGIQIDASPRALYNGSSTPIHLFAQNGRFENSVWILEKPFALVHNLDGTDYKIIKPKRMKINTTVDPQSFLAGFNLQIPMYSLATAAQRTFSQLGETIQHNQKNHILDVSTILDYHFKLSVPFSCLVMAFCCPPMALRYARGGGFMGTLLSIGLVFVYWNTLLLARILGTPGPNSPAILSPYVAAWFQNVLFALFGLYVLKKSE